MNCTANKILGSWLGLAIGDAMGAAVKGMKPSTILQCFKTMDQYKDVRPFIGKGIKEYRMKGLYGAQTQAALATCDVLLHHKRMDVKAFATCLLKLKQTGTELYFGVFRRPETIFLGALEGLATRSKSFKINTRNATGVFLTLAVPIALYYRGNTRSIVKNVTEAGRTLNCPILELTGMVMMGLLTNLFLKVSTESDNELNFENIGNLPQQTFQLAQEAEEAFENTPLSLSDGETKTISNILSKTFRWVLDYNVQNMEFNNLLTGICDNASKQLDYPVSHPARGSVLTLLPTAILITLRNKDFASAITQALHLGGESDKLGAITGALAGALYGIECIPEKWHRNLVNSKEMKIRGEALIDRKHSSRSKNLFEMESGLTLKEVEERKKFIPREPRKKTTRIITPLIEKDKNALPVREDRKGRRQFERVKSRKKRDRRKTLDSLL